MERNSASLPRRTVKGLQEHYGYQVRNNKRPAATPPESANKVPRTARSGSPNPRPARRLRTRNANPAAPKSPDQVPRTSRAASPDSTHRLRSPAASPKSSNVVPRTSRSACPNPPPRRLRTRRHASIPGPRPDALEANESSAAEEAEPRVTKTQFPTERAFPRRISQILSHRELGRSTARSWKSTTRFIPDELKEHIFDDVGPLEYYSGTSGDVVTVAWSPKDNIFAAGSIATTDERSMQYNKSCNLLLGNREKSVLFELPEHHLPRPWITGEDNPNALQSMRETQDARLFMTVTSVGFSPDGNTLYSAGNDAFLRAYTMDERPVYHYGVRHSAPIDLLSVNSGGLIATGCQSAEGSISILRESKRMLQLSPNHCGARGKQTILPSALRWCAAHPTQLLAGFSVGDSETELDMAGETCLWDVAGGAGQAIEINADTRNVFDVAWNPHPSSASVAFAVACSSGSRRAGMRTLVRCFAPQQNRARFVFEWECPALDINDVVYCPHDPHLLAAGATDGKVYIWDQRFVDREQRPLHTLAHADTLNVLDPDRAREQTDTGVRFLAWGPTASRLYSGSSDGTVKLWNPYRATESAHLADIASFGSAIMSGAFSPDSLDLLIGEDQARINVLRAGHAGARPRASRRLALAPAPAPPAAADPFAPAHALIASGEIALRPMGALPTRQAVQGPAYTGPFFAPARRTLKLAAQLHKDLRAEALAAAAAADPAAPPPALARRLEAAAQRLTNLQRRAAEGHGLAAQAAATQRRFREQERDPAAAAAAAPAPDAAPPPDDAAADDPPEVPDSLRSQSRIPGALRSARPPPPTHLLLPPADQAELGLTARCIACTGAAAPATAGVFPRCTACTLAQQGRTAACGACGAAIRPGAGGECERCAFGCLRCGARGWVGRGTETVGCETCGVRWRAGVLGYEVEGGGGARRAATERKDVEERDGYYASLWGG